MKKALFFVLAAASLAACASNADNIKMLSRADVGEMTANEVVSYYKDSNADLLDKLMFDHGSKNYDKYVSIFDGMNEDLTAMSAVQTTKENYYQKLQTVVDKRRAQIKKLQ